MLSEDLPIYKAIYNLAKVIFKYAKNMKRVDRILIGERLNNNALDMLNCVLKANSNVVAQRLVVLKEMKVLMAEIKTYLRFCIENKVLNEKQCANITYLSDKVGKQLSGWIKSTEDRVKNDTQPAMRASVDK